MVYWLNTQFLRVIFDMMVCFVSRIPLLYFSGLWGPEVNHQIQWYLELFLG